MSRVAVRSLFIFLFIINCILWSRSKYGRSLHPASQLGSTNLAKRSWELHYHSSLNECNPRSVATDDQCRHVTSKCPPPDTLLNMDYLRQYFCTDVSLRPFVFARHIFWLIFLFSTLGISASDFFTPNLATIAQLLGLDENVAGVTFLAFGNGSPDMFSTYSAMRAESGSLALGELLGAATFIVSCVVGSVCIIQPFQVRRKPFLRDVGFFAMAVSLVIVIIWDGYVTEKEAATMVGLYVAYVVLVVGGTWWDRRRERRRQIENLIRSEYAQEAPFPRYTDEPAPPQPLPSRQRTISAPNVLRVQTDVVSTPRSSSPSPSLGKLPSFSLIGALEFRDVVASLKNEAAALSLKVFDSPVAPYAGGHYHRPLSKSRSPHAGIMDDDDVQLGSRHLSLDSDTTVRDVVSSGPSDYFSSLPQSRHELPYIRPSASQATSEAGSEEQLYTPPSKRQRFWSVFRQTFHTLFPTLSNFRQQSPLAKIACVLAAPAVLGLTLTLPVVVTQYGSDSTAPEKVVAGGDARLVDFEEEGQERVLIAEEENQENMHQLQFNRWLMFIQCICGPLFFVTVVFNGTKYERFYLLGALLGGFTVGVLVLLLADRGDSVSARMARCSMGFIISVVWIMAIADEVVSVLQTFGKVFGLSDAIIGLTIFAVGNSLADLVANMSVATFAPMMGLSACFGGPMLNILLGVGLSGSYIISQTGEPYALTITSTLYVSSFGLLFLLATTLIFVPLNDYHLTRRWGIVLIATYTVIMIINIVVELLL